MNFKEAYRKYLMKRSGNQITMINWKLPDDIQVYVKEELPICIRDFLVFYSPNGFPLTNIDIEKAIGFLDEILVNRYDAREKIPEEIPGVMFKHILIDICSRIDQIVKANGPIHTA